MKFPVVATLIALLVFVSSLFAAPPAAAPPPKTPSGTLSTFSSKHYTIYTNLKREEARPFGAHMDAVFEEYSKRFSGFGRGNNKQSMPLYLFRTQDEYLDFLQRHNINATNTEGLFFVQPSIQGLATWTQNKSLSHTYAVLQHEGFHQFAFNYIGPSLPVWVNEGIAQYFEDGVIVSNKMYVGFANARRIASVQAALSKNHAIPFNTLLQMTEDRWHDMVVAGGWDAGLLYDQSWSIVFFLVNGDNEKYRGAFEQYLVLVSQGRDSTDAFRAAFGSEDTTPFRKRWESFVQDLRPDPITIALARMEFLGQGLRYLYEKKEPPPESIEELKSRLQKIDFQMMRTMLGVTVKYSSRDESLYKFPRANGTELDFRVLEGEKSNLPPRINAPGLKPEPTLIWTRDAEGQLMQDVVFK